MTPEEKAASELKEKEAREAAEKVTFSEAQQTKITEILDARFAKVQAKHEKEKKDLQDKLDAALKAAEDAAKSGKGTGDEESAEKKQAKELVEKQRQETDKERKLREAKDAEYNTLLAEHNGTLKKNAIREAAGNMFLDMEVVMAMTERNIEFDADLKKFVVKENGITKENSSFEPMTLEEYFEEFGQKRPYLVNAKWKGGAGSTESKGGNTSTGKVNSKADLKTPAEKSKFITNFGLKAFEDLPLKSA